MCSEDEKLRKASEALAARFDRFMKMVERSEPIKKRRHRRSVSRDFDIIRRYVMGEARATSAAKHGITVGRVQQIWGKFERRFTGKRLVYPRPDAHDYKHTPVDAWIEIEALRDVDLGDTASYRLRRINWSGLEDVAWCKC